MKKSVAHIAHCYGCGVCAISCGQKAIEMQLDAFGFYRPVVDADKCTDCGLCCKSCAYLDDALAEEEHMPQAWFAGWSEDAETVASCSSGGVAYELAKKALESGYKVVGVRYDVEKGRAEHMVCASVEELVQTKGSKYLPSYTVDAFAQIKKGEKWMVVGTPCQIDSLRRYVKMRKMEDDVVLVDFYCHGVPSYNMWRKYGELMLGGRDVKGIAFRAKKNYATGEGIDWHNSYVVTSEDRKGKMYQPGLEHHRDWFGHYFLDNLCLGKQCYEKCKYKMYKSSADIRIGDAWSSAFKDNEKGVSAVLAFTDKGAEMLRALKNVHKEEIELERLCEGQMRVMPKEPVFYGLRLRLMKMKGLRFGHIEKLIGLLSKLTGKK